MQIKDLNFQRIEQRQTLLNGEADILFAAKTDLGRITVLDRMTGYGHRDTETGFKDADGKFWLASGQFPAALPRQSQKSAVPPPLLSIAGLIAALR